MKIQYKILAVAAMVCAGNAVFAQAAGDWMVRAGGMTITPQVNSENLSAPSFRESKSNVSSASALAGGITYMYTDNISFDLPVAVPFKHKLYGDGAGLRGTGKVGEVSALPITLFVQYRFLEPQTTFRPYVGVGPTYAYFFDTVGSGTLTQLTNPGGSPTTFSIDNKLTYTMQVGLTMAFDKNWFGDVFYTKTPLKTRTTLSTGQTQDMTLDPEAYGVAIGYKF